MPPENKRLPHDRSDRQSIFNYAIDLHGSTLREKAEGILLISYLRIPDTSVFGSSKEAMGI